MDKGAVFQYMEMAGASQVANAVDREVADMPFAQCHFDTIFAGMVAVVDRETGEQCLWPVTNASSVEEAAQLLEAAARQLRGSSGQERSVEPH